MAEKKGFEASIEALEETVRKMEQGNLSLDESIALFEKGMELSKYCAEKLENARRRILTLTDAEAEENEDDD